MMKRMRVYFLCVSIGSLVSHLIISEISYKSKRYPVIFSRRKDRSNIFTVRSENRSNYTNPFADYHLNSYYSETVNTNNWTILLTVNTGYFDFFRNWYFAYKHLNLTFSIIIIAEDEYVYTVLQELKLEKVTVTRSEYVSVKESASYASAAFKKLVSARPSHILYYLRNGTNVLYSDIDMVWMQNPFRYFTGDSDMWISLDNKNNYCTGFMAIKSNRNCIKLMEDWEDALREKADIDQKVFNKVVKKATIRLQALDNSKFPNGYQYFEYFTEKERAFAVVVHNNWIIGHHVKLERFKKMKLWFIPNDIQSPTEFRYVIYISIFTILVAFISALKVYYCCKNINHKSFDPHNFLI